MSQAQRTISAPVELEGVTLFTGADVRVRIGPAPPDAGVVFVRADLASPVRIPASVHRVAPSEHRTSLHADGARIETVEHCLAALYGLGIVNATVEVFGPELPIGDGSCLLFTDAIESVGVEDQGADRREIVIDREFEVVCDRTGARIRAMPPQNGDVGASMRYALDYGSGAPIPAHEAAFDTGTDDFDDALAYARTFSTAQEAAFARSQGLFTHLTPRELLVIGDDGPIDNALRSDDEPARHKVIDMLGDLALAGAPLRGRIVGERSGHALNHALALRLAEL